MASNISDYDDNTLIDIFRCTFIGQDVSVFEVSKVACVCKRFNSLLYSSAFISQVYREVNSYEGSMLNELLKVGMKKYWNLFLWRRMQGAIAFHNLPMLKRIIDAGIPIEYKGIDNITPIFLCVKHNFAAGYRLLKELGAYRPSGLNEPSAYKESKCADEDRPYFQAIKDFGRNYTRVNHIYLSTAYHSYDVLQTIATLSPNDLADALSRKYRIAEGLDPSFTQLCGHAVPFYARYYGSRVWGSASGAANMHSLVSLEVLRQAPSALFIQFFLSHGYKVTNEDREVLNYKLRPTKDREIFGCIMGTPEDRADLQQIHQLFSGLK